MHCVETSTWHFAAMCVNVVHLPEEANCHNYALRQHCNFRAGKLVTVFSAPDYPQHQADEKGAPPLPEDRFNNKASVLELLPCDYTTYNVHTYAAAPRPAAKCYYDLSVPGSDEDVPEPAPAGAAASDASGGGSGAASDAGGSSAAVGGEVDSAAGAGTGAAATGTHAPAAGAMAGAADDAAAQPNAAVVALAAEALPADGARRGTRKRMSSACEGAANGNIEPRQHRTAKRAAVSAVQDAQASAMSPTGLVDTQLSPAATTATNAGGASMQHAPVTTGAAAAAVSATPVATNSVRNADQAAPLATAQGAPMAIAHAARAAPLATAQGAAEATAYAAPVVLAGESVAAAGTATSTADASIVQYNGIDSDAARLRGAGAADKGPVSVAIEDNCLH